MAVVGNEWSGKRKKVLHRVLVLGKKFECGSGQQGQGSVTVSVWVQDAKTEMERKRFVREMPRKVEKKEQAGQVFRPDCRSQLM